MRGLVLGKFMPPHLGHLHLIDVALRSTSEVTVLVCTLEREPIPGALRAAWMRELVPRARVVHVTDENPSEPHEHPAFWEIWTESIRRAEPRPIDVLFTSETYGDELAGRLGARHVMVDLERRAVPVTGTTIRERPMANWHFIPPVVRPYFVRRTVILGSESTGKTTLAAELAAHFETVWVPEFARAHLDAKPTPLDASDIEPIARGQIAAEERMARDANRVLILDTDLLSTEVYAQHYYGVCPEWISRAATERRADLYLLTDIDVPWVPDPQRDRPHVRAEMQALFRAALERRGFSYTEIRGDWSERRRSAIEAVGAMLNGKRGEEKGNGESH